MFLFKNLIEQGSVMRINETPISVQDLRVVCDNMLSGLGKELRRCGIDAVILDNDKDHSEVARVLKNFKINHFKCL